MYKIGNVGNNKNKKCKGIKNDFYWNDFRS